MKQSSDKRPVTGKRLTVSLSVEQREALEAIAAKNGASLAFVVRRAVRDFVEKHRDGQLSLSFPESF